MSDAAPSHAGAVSPRGLLRHAAAVYDAADNGLSAYARQAAWGGFRSGADWMRQALAVLRNRPAEPMPSVSFQKLGLLKYGAACAPALAVATAAVWLGRPVVAVLALPVFYAVEAQGVFLFPLALDGAARPVRAARRATRSAGGTFRVMAVVMPIAATMLGGGFVGRGFLRSWCIGCLAVCIWYERLHPGLSAVESPAGPRDARPSHAI